MSDLIDYLKENGYFELINDNDRFELFIQNLTKEKFKHIVIELNKQLRRKSKSEEYLSSYMKAGDLISPTTDIRDDIIENLIETLDLSGKLLFKI